MSKRHVIWIAALLAAGQFVVIGFRGVVPRVADLFVESLPAQPYFVPDHAALLYLAAPLVVVAALVLVIAPGLLLTLAGGGARRIDDLVVRGFGAAFVVNLVVLSATKVVLGELTTTGFIVMESAMAWLALAAVAVRVRRGDELAWPLQDRVDRRRLCWILAIPALTVVLLLPVIFWQDMIDDGLEGLEAGRTLATHVTPRFPDGGGLMGLGIGMVSMAYPIHWLVMLFGPIEASARLPLALYLPVLLAALTALIEWRSPRRLRGTEEAGLVLALAVYVLALGYSASYDPYSADVAAPAAFETLTITCMAAAVYSLWSGRTIHLFLFCLLAYFARPSGLLFVGLLGAASVLCVPQDRRSTAMRMGAALAACLAAFVLYEKVYLAYLGGGEPLAYASSSIRDRLQYLTLFDFRRVLYVCLPTGILPALSLLAFRRQDPLGRSLSAVVAAYFLFFYVQAFVALHQFVPAMILPLVVFWRLALMQATKRWLVTVTLALGVLSFWASLPRHFELYRSVREIGRVTDYRVGDYGGSYEQYRQALANRELVYELFPPDWRIEDPAREMAGASLGIVYYSHRMAAWRTYVNYVIQPATDPPPAGFLEVAVDEAGAVYVRDPDRWRLDRLGPPTTDYRSRAYEIPRETLFRHLGVPARNYDVNLKGVPLLGRLF